MFKIGGGMRWCVIILAILFAGCYQPKYRMGKLEEKQIEPLNANAVIKVKIEEMKGIPEEWKPDIEEAVEQSLKKLWNNKLEPMLALECKLKMRYEETPFKVKGKIRLKAYLKTEDMLVDSFIITAKKTSMREIDLIKHQGGIIRKLLSQVINQLKTEIKKKEKEILSKISPPSLFMEIEFKDENNNMVLDASEVCTLYITLINKLKKATAGVKVGIDLLSPDYEEMLEISPPVNTGIFKKWEKKIVKQWIMAGPLIQSGQFTIRIKCDYLGKTIIYKDMYIVARGRFGIYKK